MGSHIDVFKVTGQPKEVARTIIYAATKHGWKITRTDTDYRMLVAELKRPLQVGNTSWKLEYQLVIEWQESDSNIDCEFKVHVQESTYNWTNDDCKKKANEIKQVLITALKEKSKQIAQDKKGARWATTMELVHGNYLFTKIASQNLIVAFTPGSYIALPEEETYRHALICGPTGSSKTTGIFEPNLFLRTQTSAIVTEATATKGRAGLFERTSGYRRAKGQEVFYFNPDDLRSHRINPISFVESYKDARRITEIIMQSTTLSTHRGDQSWEMAEKTLLTALVLHVVSMRSQNRDTFAEIMNLICLGGEGLVKIAEESPVDQARELITTFLLTTTEPFRNLVINQLVNRLDLWQQPRIRALTEKTDIDFKSLKDKLFTIYLAVPAAKHELKPLSALILNTILELVGTIGFTKPLALFLDEFTNFGLMRGMPQRLTIMRHDRIPVVLGVQDYAQLELMYKEEAKLLISQPGTRIFFKPNDYTTAELISKMLGTAIEQTNQIASTGHLKETKEKEPLLSIDDLLNLRSEERQEGIERAQLIAFLPKARPIRESAFSWKDFEHLSNPLFYPPSYLNAIELEETLVTDLPQIEQPNIENQEDSEISLVSDDVSITGW